MLVFFADLHPEAILAFMQGGFPMSENVLETIDATVQDFLAPELKTHGVRLSNL